MYKIPHLGIAFSNGDEWEEFCHSCLKLLHRDENYKSVDASNSGDSGIDGFTSSGKVYQCYCPEKEYTDSDLYEKQRDKITTDIQKLYNYQESIKILLNGIKIKTWHLDRKSTRLNSSHVAISYAVFCLKKKIKIYNTYKIKRI